MSKWIEWNGGEMPVPKGTPIWVKCRDSREYRTKAGYACAINWKKTGSNCDITAYKLRKGWRFNEGQPDCELVDLIMADGSKETGNPDDYYWDSVRVEAAVFLWRPAKSLKTKAAESAPEGERIPPKEGWNVNTGVMPDVQDVANVDVILRNGSSCVDSNKSLFRWSMRGGNVDILYWRIHDPYHDPYRELREAQDAGRLITFDQVLSNHWLIYGKSDHAFCEPFDKYKIIPLELSDKLRETYNAYQDALKQVKEYK